MSKKVIIDLGHLNCDSGAVANGFREVDLNNSIGRYTGAALLRSKVDVVYSSGSLSDRSALENRIRPNCFVSIHNNAGGGDGTEVYLHNNAGSSTLNLANAVYNEIVPKLNNGRGVKRANFHVLRETVGSAILIECAFMDSKDIQAVDTDAEREAFGEAIAKGICKWLGVQYIPKTPQPIQNKPQNEGNLYYRVVCGSFKDKKNAEERLAKLKAAGFDGFLDAFKK